MIRAKRLIDLYIENDMSERIDKMICDMKANHLISRRAYEKYERVALNLMWDGDEKMLIHHGLDNGSLVVFAWRNPVTGLIERCPKRRTKRR